jgi:hypothetical protein
MKCAKCGHDKPDVMLRSLKDKDLKNADGQWIDPPALCTACCATYPGRQWMRGER